MTDCTHCWHLLVSRVSGGPNFDPCVRRCCHCGAFETEKGAVVRAWHGPYVPGADNQDEWQQVIAQAVGRYLQGQLK